MIIDGTDIEIPYDTPHAYRWDWRSQTVDRLAEADDDLREVCKDLYVQLYQTYKRMMCDDTFLALAREKPWDSAYESSPGLPAVIKACDISDTPEIADKLEALLLCPKLSFNDIGQALGMTSEAVSTYSRLFYDIRDEEGRVKEERGLRELMALKGAVDSQTCCKEPAGHWRIAAFESGHSVLFALWGWPVGGIVPEFTDIDIQVSLLKGAFKNLDYTTRRNLGADNNTLARLTQDIVTRFEKLRTSGIVSAKEHIPETHIIMKMLQKVGMRVAETSDEAEEAMNEKFEQALLKMNDNKNMDEDDGSDKNETLDQMRKQMEQI